MSGLPLVTGGTGFAGSHLLEHLLTHGPEAVAWGNPSGRPVPAANGHVRWRAVNVLDQAAVTAALREAPPSVIYHCAGIAHVGNTWADPARALEVNVVGTHRVLEGVRAAGLSCPVLVTGSALVYRPSEQAIDEDHPIGPTSPYGVSKLAQEMVALQDRDVRVYLVRPFNHAGPRQDDTYVTSSFARQIAGIEAGLREPVIRVGNLDAHRDITDVRDTVHAYQLLVERGVPGRPYNVCCGTAYRVGDLLDHLLSLSTVQVRVEADPDRMRPSDNPVVLGDGTRLRHETGWFPRIPIDRTLEDLLEYWRGRVVASAP